LPRNARDFNRQEDEMPFLTPVILGSVRSDRQGLKAARFITRHLEGRGCEAPIVDPVQLNFPLLDRMYKEYPKGDAPEALERLADLF
jgi:NAD(P)H-dependent FMN reductase